MPSRSIEDCTPRLQNVWSMAVPVFKKYHPEVEPFLTCTHRSNEEQAELYAQGRTKEGPIVTWAIPGSSPHNKNPAHAFDVAFKNEAGKVLWDEQLFELMAEVIKAIDPTIVWGGTWRKKDTPHWETADWKHE